MVQQARLELLKKMYEEDTSDSFVRFALAKEYEKLDEYTKATKFYLELIEDDAKYVGTYYHLAKLYEKQNELHKAAEIYQKGINIAKSIDDKHALGELNEAFMVLQMDME